MQGTNPVEEYLTANPNIKLSIKSLSKKLDLKKRYIVYLVNNSSHIRQVAPIEIGSLKYKIGVYTFV